MKALVLASAVTYKKFIVTGKLNPVDYRRIDSCEQLHGYKDTILLDIGGIRLRSNMDCIEALCHHSGIDIIKIGRWQ